MSLPDARLYWHTYALPLRLVRRHDRTIVRDGWGPVATFDGPDHLEQARLVMEAVHSAAGLTLPEDIAHQIDTDVERLVAESFGRSA